MSKVLLVDDEEGIRRLLSEALRHKGFDVDTAGSAEEAEKAFIENPFDVVVSDVHMPGGDGFELARRISGGHPSVPVILVTGDPSSEGLEQSLAPPFFAYVAKPVDIEYLAALVRKAAQKANAMRNDPAS